jgi:hypothetical protein
VPLLDHFHPPVSGRKEWAGFALTWATTITTNLNMGLLPEGIEAEPRCRAGFEIEEQEAVHLPAPLTGVVEIADPDSFEVLVYRDTGRWTLAAAIELVSPANKDREAHRRTFATKCLAYLAKGVSVVVIDMVTNRTANMHAELVRHGGLAESFAWESASGLSVVSYRTLRNKADVRLDVWPTELFLGQPLPTVPLWLTADLCVPLELEPTYHAACVGLRLAAA